MDLGGCGRCDGNAERLAADIDRLDHQVNGNGQEGLVQKLDRVIRVQSEQRGAAASRAHEEDRHYRTSERWLKIIMMVLSALTAFIGWLALARH